MLFVRVVCVRFVCVCMVRLCELCLCFWSNVFSIIFEMYISVMIANDIQREI